MTYVQEEENKINDKKNEPFWWERSISRTTVYDMNSLSNHGLMEQERCRYQNKKERAYDEEDVNEWAFIQKPNRSSGLMGWCSSMYSAILEGNYFLS